MTQRKYDHLKKSLVGAILADDLELAVRLVKKVKKLVMDDENADYQILSVVIFMAGIERALNLLVLCLYLARRIDREWLNVQQVGDSLICKNGLIPKLDKLKELGMSLSPRLWELADLRHNYVHSSGVSLGYRVGLDQDGQNIQILPEGPAFYGGSKHLLGGFDQRWVELYSIEFMEESERLMNKLKIWPAINRITARVARMPVNPQPEYEEILQHAQDVSRIEAILAKINRKYFGAKYEKVLLMPKGA